MTDALIPIPDHPLTWWRSLPPHQIARRKVELLDELLALTRPLVSDQLIGQVMAGRTEAALVILDELGFRLHLDLAGSWMAWAALNGDALAPGVLAEYLVRWSQAHPEDEVPPSLEEMPEDAELWSRIGRRLQPWRGLLSGLTLSTPEDRDVLSRNLARQLKLERDATGDEPVDIEDLMNPPPLDAPPTRIVVHSIGDTGREGRGIAEAYRALTRPLPLAGTGMDPDLVASVLVTEFPWMAEATDMVRGELALRQRAGVPWLHLRPILLLGPTGVGKTRFARRLAQLAGTGYSELSAAGASDNRTLQGTARGWSSAQPAWPLQVIRDSGTANPVILVDEIDKATGSHNGDVRHTLLGFLEGHTAAHWYDECLMARCDVSGVSWILTANRVDHLPGPLLSRVAIVRVDAPKPEHFEKLYYGMLRDIAEDLGVRVEDLPVLREDIVASLRDGFTRTPDIRRLVAALRRALQAGAREDLAARH